MKKVSTSTATQFDPVQLIESHQAGVWRYLRALGCDASLADDITQETFLAVLRRPFDDYNRSATAAYLRKVAYNLFITVQRRASRITAVDDIEAFDAVWDEWTDEDHGESMLEALRDCLRQLTERARWALELRFRDKLPRIQIGEALGITEHGAKNLMQRAKQQLRICIDNKLHQSDSDDR